MLVQDGSQSIHLVFEPSETAEERPYLNVYSCIWRKRWLCCSSRTRPHHRIIVWPVQTFGPAVSQPFSAILGVFGGGTAILGVFGGGTAQKRLDPNMRLCGQVVLSFELQPPAPMYHRLAVSQPIPSPKCKFSVRMQHRHATASAGAISAVGQKRNSSCKQQR